AALALFQEQALAVDDVAGRLVPACALGQDRQVLLGGHLLAQRPALVLIDGEYGGDLLGRQAPSVQPGQEGAHVGLLALPPELPQPLLGRLAQAGTPRRGPGCTRFTHRLLPGPAPRPPG